MNLRDKFIWNMVIGLSFLAIIWYGWSLYNINFTANTLYNKFINEEVGTDQKLENKVAELENIYSYRVKADFKTNQNPFDLSRVIVDGNSIGKKGQMWITGTISTSRGIFAMIKYRGNDFKVVKGDSVAGGLVRDITDKKVVFEKNNIIKNFYDGIDYNR